jgi:transcriptional regulator with XRE-family HTH domain
MIRKQTEIGKLIALARELKGWTIRDLEKESGVSNVVISQIETGHIKEPGFHKTMQICAALGISANRIEKAAQDERFLKVLR